ncbi:allantoinase PuuE [Notoacmeibacter ruber]|uniref:Chitooligosaccharide deacetylase n=1 Tax=Notoacmeibacter ruber TaxID=2670375 RepID=A0A3L7JFJ3_9HYPH|nr:allantoinase PuuE [Notoacmeibacter ruber]
MKRYPRNMIGYGPNPPDPKWPAGAKIAVQVVLNYEEGGENNILHGDAASEAFLSEIIGAAQWPGQRHWNMESIYEYGARAGFWRLHRIFTEAGVPLTIYGVATALARSPEQVAAMKAADWEIASHGLKWVEYKDISEEEEREHIAEAVRLHTEVVGARPRGLYVGRSSMQSIRLGAEEGGFAYLADAYDDDLPHYMRFGDREQLIVPYTLDANDMRFAVAAGFADGEEFFRYLRDAFDMLLEEGRAGAPKMMNVGLHCRLAGRPGRAMAVKRFLEHALGHGDEVWFATRLQIAEHWRQVHPPETRERPSSMDKAQFVEKFGGVYEHSPWVAEKAFELELGPAHDRAAGLANALARAFRRASPEDRLAVLKAHPDLAGKLASARRLTADSSAEQASAGLDALTDEERARFEQLNAAYTQKHDFPFIIAVRDHDKNSILRSFEERIGNDTETERETAARQVERIAELRLRALLL